MAGGREAYGQGQPSADLAENVAAKLHVPMPPAQTAERVHPGILTHRMGGCGVQDEDGELSPGGSQTPAKMVRFPSEQ